MLEVEHKVLLQSQYSRIKLNIHCSMTLVLGYYNKNEMYKIKKKMKL